MSTTCYGRVLSVLMACACARALAADVAVGYQETKDVNVPTDAVQTGDVVVAPRGTVRKTGEGVWTVPTGNLFLRSEAGLMVEEGTLTVEPSAAPTAVKPVGVDEILAGAALWLDCRKEGTVLTDASENVTAWLDARETGNATDGYVYSRGVSETSLFASNPLYPIVQTDAESGLEGVYFRGVKSGCWMKFLCPDGSRCDCKAYNVFVVHGVRSGLGTVLGIRKSSFNNENLAFVAGNSSGTTFYPLWITTADQVPAIFTARTYVNGEFYEGSRSSYGNYTYHYPQGFTLLEVELLSKPGQLNCLYNDRGYMSGFSNPASPLPSDYQNAGGVRLGGDYVSELVVFTNRLETSQRLTVQRYLMNKWFGVSRPASIDASVLSPGAVKVNVREAGDEDIPVVVSGDGAYVKDSADETLVPPETFSGFVGRIGMGETANFLHWGDYPFALKPGCSYLADVDQTYRYVRSSVFAGKDAAITAVKNGTDELKVDDLATNVERLAVNAGTLRLAAPTAAACASRAAKSAVQAVITNPSFEEGVGPTQEKTLKDGDVLGGWHVLIPSGSSAFFYNGTYAGGGGHNAGAWRPMPTNLPDGRFGLGIQKDASAWTEIEIPEDGVYRFSIRADSRHYTTTDNLGHALSFAVGPDADHLTTFGRFLSVTCGNTYPRYTYRMPYLTKGTYQLWIKASGANADRTTVFDCLEAVREEPGEEWLLPNGNFEDLSGSFSGFTTFAAANAAAVWGWTLTQPTDQWGDSGKGASFVAPATPLMSASGITGPGIFYDLTEGDGTAVNLQLCRGGSAACTFVPPEGEWRLRVNAKTCRYTSSSDDYVDFRATVTPQGGAEVDLGTISHIATLRTLVDTFPTKLRFDGKTSVTVRLWCERTGKGIRAASATDAHLCIDNVRLAPVDDELLSDGGFESGSWAASAWDHVYFSEGKYGPLDSQFILTSEILRAYGKNPPVGLYALRLLAESITYQPVTFPAAGDYRLEMMMRPRVGNSNPVKLWYAKGGVTNMIANPVTPVATNFVHYAWNFRVKEAGDYVFGIEGTQAGEDQTTLIDEVHLRPVKLLAEAPEVSPHLRIKVASGAKLNLDFPGTVTVSRVSLSGVNATGIVTSETHPDAVIGPGALKIEPLDQTGLILIVR